MHRLVQPRDRAANYFAEEFEAQSTETIISQIKRENRTHLHFQLSSHKNRKGQPSIWQGVHALRIRDKKSLQQKLEMIHNLKI